MYRFYLKTLGVIVEGRLSAPGGKGGERKKDKWVSDTDTALPSDRPSSST